MTNDFMNVHTRLLTFSNRWGRHDEQLNRILDCQQDAPNYFKIKQIIPVYDNGGEYYWIYYYGDFPDEKEWEKKDE